MADLLVQIVGLAALFVVLAWGYRRWLAPRQPLGFQASGLLLLFILTFAGGLIGSTGWWVRDPRSFSWLLPPLASRMLASAAWAFAFATYCTLQRPSYRRVRLTLVMLMTYFIPLTAAVVLFHLDRFDFNAPITYAFFTIVIIMMVSTLWYFFRQPGVIAETPADRMPAPAVSRAWLMVVAVVTGLWGLALFAADAGPLSWVWVWPGDLLTSRLISVMLLTIATGSLYSLGVADTARMMLWVTVIYGAGLAVASLWNLFADRPVPVSYVIIFGVMAAVSGVLLTARRQTLQTQPT